MEWFYFDGVASAEFGAFLAKSNMFDAPKRDVSSVTVAGRNGVLHIDNGRFEAFKTKCTVYIPRDLNMSIDALRNYLMSKGTCRYVETWKPSEYRMATFTDAFEVKGSDRQGAYFDLVFECSPERWLVAGEKPIDIAVNGSALVLEMIYNHSKFASRPLIVAQGTGSISIGDVALTLSANTSATYIDCELRDAYEGTINRNGDLTITGDDFPELVPGNNVVTATGFTSLQIIPRWWTI